jgi:hypothetical protein
VDAVFKKASWNQKEIVKITKKGICRLQFSGAAGFTTVRSHA